LVSGLQPASAHPTDIHFGTCAGGGPTAYALADLVARANGTARGTATITGLTVIPPQGWFIVVHQGPTLAATGSAPVACGDVSPGSPVFAPRAQVAHNPVTVMLQPQNDSSATGVATLTFVGSEALAVRLSVSGLEAGSVHPAHIHFGTCAAGGPIGYPLDDLIAGPDGVAVGTTLVSGVRVIPTEGWYINVHQGPTLADGGATPIACGDVHPALPTTPGRA